MDMDVMKLQRLQEIKDDAREALKILQDLREETLDELRYPAGEPLTAVIFQGIFAEVRSIRASQHFAREVSIGIGSVMDRIRHQHQEFTRMEANRKEAPDGNGGE